ncbi:hypothetical protein F5Y19DRAFT_479022 [Xylariaceae sp. FL1651]|nr:hypothetical protein F5Y19DRAFT_479022 [Xylariaceae sp. FL1651]
MAPSSPSSPSQTHHTLNLEDGEDVLRSKRSSVTVEWSDGYKVIFVRPCRPRSGPYSGSQSRSASQSLSGLDLQNGRREDRAHSRLTSVHPQSSVQGSNSERERHNLTSGSGFAAERGATKLQDRRQSRMSLAVSSNGHQRSTTAPAPEEARFVFPLRERESEAWDAVYNISNEEQHRRGYRSQGQELGQQRCESKDPNMRISNALLQRSSSMFAEDGRNSPRVGQGENEGPNHPNQVQHMPSIQSHKQRRASTSPPFIAHSGSPCLNPPLSPLVTDPRRTMPIHPQPFYNDGASWIFENQGIGTEIKDKDTTGDNEMSKENSTPDITQGVKVEKVVGEVVTAVREKDIIEK